MGLLFIPQAKVSMEEHDGMIPTEENRKTQKKTLSQYHFFPPQIPHGLTRDSAVTGLRLCEISSSHGGEYEAQNGCRLTFQALMMEATRTYGTSVDIQLRIRQYIPEDSELQA
jgi:hypothetical protein